MKELLWWEESGPGFLSPPPSPLPTPLFSNSIMFPILLLFSQWLWLDDGFGTGQSPSRGLRCLLHPLQALNGILLHLHQT